MLLSESYASFFLNMCAYDRFCYFCTNYRSLVRLTQLGFFGSLKASIISSMMFSEFMVVCLFSFIYSNLSYLTQFPNIQVSQLYKNSIILFTNEIKILPNISKHKQTNYIFTIKLQISIRSAMSDKQKIGQMHQNGSMKCEGEQFTMREDIINFSNQLALSARNKYKRKSFNHQNILNLQKTLKIQKGTGQKNARYSFETDQKTKISQITSTEALSNQRKSSDVFCIKNRASYSGSSEGLREKPEIAKRQIFTMRNRRRSIQKNKDISWQNFNFKKQKITQSQQLEDEQTTNTYKQLQKKYNKGNISSTGVLEWLNEALIEATPSISVSKNNSEQAIKYYGIDRSSLLSKGINPDKVQRVYKSLFVYSIGFNSLLKQICPSMILRKSLWRVYAILLEYCSGGNFETMIGQIQRDKAEKLNELKFQIEKRQKIIEYNQEINQSKNAKIYKELKQIQDNNNKLLEERDIILRDFHEAEQAFAQEVQLRMKYENRINEIHGVYEEMRMKSQNLKEAHLKQKQTNLSLKDKTAQLNHIITTLKIQLQHLSNEKRLGERMNILLNQQVKNLQKNLQMANKSYNIAKQQYQNQRITNGQLLRKVEQLQKRLSISRNSEESVQKSLKVSHEEYERSLRENIELHQTSKIQISINNDLMKQVREFNVNTSDLHAQITLKNGKIEQEQLLNKQLRLELKHNEQIIEKKQLQLATEMEMRRSLEDDLTENNKNMAKMKQKQQKLQEDYHHLQTENLRLNQLLQCKHKQIKDLKNTIEGLNTQIYVLNKDIKTKQTTITILQDKLTSQIQINKERFNKLTKQYEHIKQKYEQYQRDTQSLAQESQKNKELYEAMFAKFKNQKFQRNNLELRYKQSLAVMQEENQHIKKLNIRISELNEQIDQLNRKLINNQYIYKKQSTRLSDEVTFWKKQMDIREQELRKLRMYVHPSKYEDLYGQLLRLSQKYQNLFSLHKKLQTQYKNKQKSGNIKSTKLLHDLEQSQKQKQCQITRNLQKKEKELQFEKQKNAYHKKKINEMEQDAAKLRAQTTRLVEEYRKQLKSSEEKVKQKNNLIKNLNNRVEELALEKIKIVQEKQLMQKKHQAEFKNIKNHPTKNKGYQASARKSSKQSSNLLNQDLSQNAAHQNIQQKNLDHPHHQNDKTLPKSDLKTENNKYISQYNSDDIQIIPSKELSNNVSEQSPKKREDIRKKLKGAYMYYHK